MDAEHALTTYEAVDDGERHSMSTTADHTAPLALRCALLRALAKHLGLRVKIWTGSL